MNWVNTIKSTIKNFTWELSHTLINYLFGLSIKKELKINPNCYIFLKTKNNRLITSTNYVKYSDKDYFNYLECKKVNAHINRSLIPTMYIEYLELSPKIENIFKPTSSHTFKSWLNGCWNTTKSIFRLEGIIRYLLTNSKIHIKNLIINIDNFKLEVTGLRGTKNKDEINIQIKKIRIVHLDTFIGKLKNIKLTYYIEENRITSYVDNMIIHILEKSVRNRLVENTKAILNKIPESNNKMNFKFLVNETKIIVEVANTINFHIKNLNIEKDRLSLPYLNAKIWKKDILWANNVIIPLDNPSPIIESIRLRLFSSTCDKIFKTLIVFKKQLYTKTKKLKKKKIKSSNYSDKRVVKNYFRNIDSDLDNSVLSDDNSITDISTCSDDFEYEYLEGFLKADKNIKLFISELEISFEHNHGKFQFSDFSYEKIDKDIVINTKRWLFHKDNIRLIDKIDQNNDKFSVIIGNSSLKIIPHKIYLNLDIEIFSDCFSILIRNIGRFCQIWSNSNNTHQVNYVFEKVYIGSFFCVFSYSQNKFSIENLIDGNLIEILNLVGMNNLQLILEDINIMYPKDWTSISRVILNKYLKSLKDRNLKNILKKTPISNLKNVVTLKSNFKYYTNKLINTIK